MTNDASTGRAMLGRTARLASIAVAAGGLFAAGLTGIAPGAGLAGVGAQEAPALCAAAETPITGDEEQSVADVAEKVSPAVVTITNVVDGNGEGDGEEAFGGFPVGTGSGFIVDKAGRVLTNAHVVEGADELSVELYDGTTVPATVVGADATLDVAIVQLDLPNGVELPGIATLGDSDALRPGDRVVAIGSALGELTHTVTDGTVNAVGRAFGTSGTSSTIQHDAEIWPGNSGGPLINLRGEVVGINFAGLGGAEFGAGAGGASIGFAIESNAACRVADQLIATGSVVRPYLGISAQGSREGYGQEVAEVVPGTGADEAGLEPGDVITALDGDTFGPSNTLQDALFERRPGDTVTLTVERDGAEQTIELVLGERPADTD